jgi:hypothetical protein
MSFWKPKYLSFSRYAAAPVVEIDNRAFVIGLDELYRNAMKRFESETLLPCARTLTKTLGVSPANVPIEGYYHETPALREYFLRMRRLQEVDESAEAQVARLREFQLLWDVTSSPLFGRAQRQGKLLPVGRDPLTQALLDTRPNWHLENLVKAAYEAAIRYDDVSLVGLAARCQDAVTLAATRESVVLYDEVATLGGEPEHTYLWRVDAALAEAANRFITTFNRFVPGGLPEAMDGNAEVFYKAYADNDVIGRCVRIGKTEDGSRHYHWAIATRRVSLEGLDLLVDEFWSDELWTTEDYRGAQRSPRSMEPFQTRGVPRTWRSQFGG